MFISARIEKLMNKQKANSVIAVYSNKIQNGDGNVTIENQLKEIEHLQQLLAEKEKNFADKEETIQILMDKK